MKITRHNACSLTIVMLKLIKETEVTVVQWSIKILKLETFLSKGVAEAELVGHDAVGSDLVVLIY